MAFLARYDLDFAEITLAANENKGLIIIASFHRFRDASPRSSYLKREFFYRDGGRAAMSALTQSSRADGGEASDHRQASEVPLEPLAGGQYVSPRRASAEDLSGQLSFEAQLELCQCADEHGIDSLLMAIGFTRPDPILLSTCLGLKTRHVKFMVACQPGLISPAAFVQQINTLALFVGGRVHINIVGGHTPRELQYYGDWLPRAERYARLDEFLTACRAFWDSGRR